MKLVENIKLIDLDKLKEYNNNPKEHPEKQIETLINSIKEFGFSVPIIIDKENEIIAGHARFEASKRLEIDKVPCIKRNDLSEEQVKAFRIADNKITESSWDYEQLALEFEQLEFENYDLKKTGFNEEEIENILEEAGFNEDPPEDFKEYDENIETENKCPKCGYEW